MYILFSQNCDNYRTFFSTLTPSLVSKYNNFQLPSLREPDSSLATLLSMPELLELPQERPPSTSPTRSSTPAPGAAPGTTTREPTTGSLVARLFKMVPWDFWLVLQAQPLLIMPKEILVEDNDILDYTKRLTHDMVL